MRALLVHFHRIAAGGSIRVITNEGKATYLTENELRERLERIPTPTKRIDQILHDLSEGRAEHVLSFDGPNPDMEAFLIKTFTGAASPAERRQGWP